MLKCHKIFFLQIHITSISLATAKVNARDKCKDTYAYLLTFSENVLIKTREREKEREREILFFLPGSISLRAEAQ